MRSKWVSDRLWEQFDELNHQVAELYEQQQFGLAIPVAERSRALAEQHWGKQHPDYATSVCNLAELHHELGRYAETEPLYLEAIDIRRATLDESDPDLAFTKSALRLDGRRNRQMRPSYPANYADRGHRSSSDRHRSIE